MNKPHQRKGAQSNAQVGKHFELLAQKFFEKKGFPLLQRNHKVPVGVADVKKHHAFDLGCSTQKILIECKSHRWTAGHNIPSAKLTEWNEAMFYFHTSPIEYRKILFVLKDLRHGNGESLATYFIRTNGHFIPPGVEIWEYDESTSMAEVRRG